MQTIKTQLQPPDFEDEDQNALARTLNAVLLVGIGGALVSCAIVMLVVSNPLGALAFYGGLSLALALLSLLLRRGLVRLSIVLLVILVWLFVTRANIALGGLDSPALSAYLITIIVAGLLLGASGALGMVAINALALLAFYLGAREGLLTGDGLSQPGLIAVNISIYVLAALFLYIPTRSLEDAYRRTRRNEDALRQTLADLQATTVSKDYVNNIIQSMSNLLIVMDPDGTIRSVNQATLDLLGYTEEELVGQHFNEMILANNPDRLSTTLLVRAQVTRNVNQYFSAKDGRLIPVSLSSSVMYHDLGYALGVVAVAQDETERTQIEEKLQYHADLLENVSDAIISTTMDLTITSWNAAAEDVYGWRADEVIGRNLMQVIHTSFEDPTQEDMIKKQYIERGHWQSEVIQRRKDGKQLHILSSISLLRNNDGMPVGTVTVNHDITQRKQAENELKKRVDQLAALRQVDLEISSTLDLVQVIEVALNAAVNLAGAEDGFVLLFSEEVGRILRTSGDYRDIDFEHSSQLPGIAGRTMDEQQPQLIEDVRQHADCDDLLPEACAAMAFPLRFHEHAVGVIHLETRRCGHFTPENFDFMKLLASRIATAIDNARLYQVSQHQLTELQQLYTQVSSLEQLKTDMIRIASHDLRNPVGIINGYLELMRLDVADRLDETEREYLAGIDEAVKRMHSIVTDILSLERIQQVAHKPFSDRVDMAELAERVVHGHTLEAEKKNLELHLELRPGQQPFNVSGDRAQLVEAVANLLTNAIKYTPEGGDITVQVAQQGGRVALVVQDTGYGIPESQQERLFQPFYRVQTRETSAIDGLGLGLHLVKNIVERHKGRMLFESTYGEGSSFGFELPLIPEI